MKVFVAAQPIDDRDFSFAVPGELVHLPPLICDCPDCGCDRAMAGLVSHKGTTSFIVRDLDLDPETYFSLMIESLRSSGWIDESPDDKTWADEFVNEHIALAADLPVEVALEVSEDLVTVRSAQPG